MVFKKAINKYFIFAVICSFFYISISFYLFSKNNDYYDSRTYDIQQETANIINVTHHTQTAGFGPAVGRYAIVGMNLNFNFNDNISQKEIRNIILDGVDTYLSKINNDKLIRPYLVEYPFPSKRLHISIFFYNKDNSEPSFPNFTYVSLINDIIYYHTDKDHDIFSHTAVETVEEARRLINEK